MKTIRLTLELKSVILTAIVVLWASNAKAPIILPPTNAFVFPPIGTLQKISDYTVSSLSCVMIFALVYETNGQETSYGGTIWYKGSTVITNKAQLDQQYILPGLSNVVIYNFCTNSNPIYDKSKGIIVYIGCEILTPSGLSSQDMLYYGPIKIYLVKNTDGSYSVPNLSGFATLINDSIPFYVPNLQWARLEVGNKGTSTPFAIYDNNYASGSSPISSDGFLYLSTAFITNSSSSTGNLWVKTSLIDVIRLIPGGSSNLFQIFNGDGNIVPENPLQLVLSEGSNSAFCLTVNGGDSGHGFVLQSSTNLARNAWNNCSSVAFVSSTNEVPSFITILTTNICSFFRLATTNLPPTN
jgi:hypothetical protein